MNEAFDMWTVAKNPQDYHLFFTDWSSIDARDFVRRDRNHPSVVIWSIGNEIHDTPYPLVAQSIITRLTTIFHAEDPTRPVTMALFRPDTTHDYENGTADLLDVVGQNYRETELAKAHADKPGRAIIGTENSRNRASWIVVRDDPAYAGMFLCTGVDYPGEADRRPHDETVEVYANTDTVELFLNGRSPGRNPRHADDSAITWQVPFAAGELRAVSYRGGHNRTRGRAAAGAQGEGRRVGVRRCRGGADRGRRCEGRRGARSIPNQKG